MKSETLFTKTMKKMLFFKRNNEKITQKVLFPRWNNCCCLRGIVKRASACETVVPLKGMVKKKKKKITRETIVP